MRDRRKDPTLADYDLDNLGIEFAQMCHMRYFVRPNITLAFFSLSLVHRDRPDGTSAQEYIDLYRFVLELWKRKAVRQWKPTSS